MLLTFLYHCINQEKYSNSIEMIEKQFSYFSKKYRTVVPGDKLNPFKLNICLTFDDAYFDFYHFIFPILKKFQMKALLAVPIQFIQPSTSLDPQIRLSVPYSQAMKGSIYMEKVPFCTWEEIQEMVNSGLVSIANHSYHHKNLLENKVDLHTEIVVSKKILEEKIQKEITTFVYPLGKFNKEIHEFTKKHYKYIVRIGSAFNLGWHNINRIVYRVISDNLQTVDEHLKAYKYISYTWFYFLNTFRGR